MTQPIFLPPDDLPPSQVAPADVLFRQELEKFVAKCFYESCDGVIQGLLLSCKWSISTTAKALTLTLDCPDMATNWRVLHNMVAIGTHLSQYAEQARIRVCPPPEMGTPFDIRVDEISIYRDSFLGES